MFCRFYFWVPMLEKSENSCTKPNQPIESLSWWKMGLKINFKNKNPYQRFGQA
jgi:hypothetical protein